MTEAKREAIPMSHPDIVGHMADAVRDMMLTRFGKVLSFEDSRRYADEILALSEQPQVSDDAVIDIDKLAWERIQEAASQSTWMPPEYMMNDWLADVCSFLRDGPQVSAQPQVDRASVLEEAARECEKQAELSRLDSIVGHIDPLEGQMIDAALSKTAAAIRSLASPEGVEP